MEPVLTNPAATSTTIQPVAFDGLAILRQLFNNANLPSYGVLEILGTIFNVLWSTFAIFSYLLSIFMLLLFVYASTNIKKLRELQLATLAEKEKIFDEQFRSGPKNDRLADVFNHLASDNPNDWKLAIIEADILLDQALKDRGYAGVSLGERLRALTPTQLQSLDDAWNAHKVRNQIAHGGADFVLTRRLADETIKHYRRVLIELGVM